MIEALEDLHWNQKETQRQHEPIKCFLKKRLGGAPRVDLKAEGWSQTGIFYRKAVNRRSHCHRK